MDRERKKLLATGIFFGVVLLVLVVFFFFGERINSGTLIVEGEAPFTIEVFQGDAYQCPVSPCILKMRSGRKNFIISKSDHKSILTEARIRRWKETLITASFEINPQLVRAESLPQKPHDREYKLIIDSKNGQQKLVDIKDPRARALVYFQDAIKNPAVIGGEKSALVIGENSAYRVDLENKSRARVDNEKLQGIAAGNWSVNGKYLVFARPDSARLWLLNEKNEVVETSLEVGLGQTAWAYDNSLVFVSGQAANPAAMVGKYGEDYIELLDAKSSAGFNFGFYHPDENSYTKIGVFSQITSLPQELMSSANSQIIYFRAGAENFKIILRKF